MKLKPNGNLFKFVAKKSYKDRNDAVLKATLIKIVKKSPVSSSLMARMSLQLHDLDIFRHAIEISSSRKVTGSADEVLDELVKFLNGNVPQRLPGWRQW